MRKNLIAIIGGGPAGALTAAMLAGAGRDVTVFDEKLAWEKPCGGGITHKALVQYPFLRDAHFERNWVAECELISPAGRRVSFHLDQPIAIFSRRVLNRLLLKRARESGAQVLQMRVTGIQGTPGDWRLQTTSGEIDASYLVIATGARNPFRAQFSTQFAAQDLMATAGYYIPGSSSCMQVQFPSGLHGYVWIFPRADHYSAGICGKMNDKTTRELRQILEDCLVAEGLEFKGAKFYAHVLPALSLDSLRHAAFSGEGWAMIGDAAGFTDPITGEGVYYALRSAELLSQALLGDRPETYPALVRKDFQRELEMAARVANCFFTGRWMGQAVTERMVQFTGHSPGFQELMCDMFAGTQGYLNLRRRLCRTLPAIAAECAISALGLGKRPYGAGGGPARGVGRFQGRP